MGFLDPISCISVQELPVSLNLQSNIVILSNIRHITKPDFLSQTFRLVLLLISFN